MLGKSKRQLTEPEYQQTLADQGWVAQWQIVIYCSTLKVLPCHCQWLHYKKYAADAAADDDDDADDDDADDDDDDADADADADADDENNINAQQFS